MQFKIQELAGENRILHLKLDFNALIIQIRAAK